VNGAGRYLFDFKALDTHAIFLHLHYKKMEINSSSLSAIYRIVSYLFFRKEQLGFKERKWSLFH